MADYQTVMAILLMAVSTYLTRILGFLALRDRTFDKRITTVLEAVPGCVLISIIAPAFVSNRKADIVALAVTIIAASRLSLLQTVIIGIVAAALCRSLL